MMDASFFRPPPHPRIESLTWYDARIEFECHVLPHTLEEDRAGAWDTFIERLIHQGRITEERALTWANPYRRP